MERRKCWWCEHLKRGKWNYYCAYSNTPCWEDPDEVEINYELAHETGDPYELATPYANDKCVHLQEQKEGETKR